MNAWLAVSLGATFVAVTLVSWALFSAASSAAVPVEPESAERLPWTWRLGWPIIARIAPAIARFVGVAHRERVRAALARAALDAQLSPEHLVAGQLLLAIAAAVGVGAALAALGSGSLPAVLAAAALGAALPRLALRDRIARRRHSILRQLPHDLDLVTLSVEAGLNLGAALAHAATHGPSGALRDEWRRVLRDVHAGQPRHEALRAMSARLALPAVSNVVAALVAAERQGASLASILRAQAEQRRTERFLRAEKLAMEAPVKMLLPLVLFIFPGTFAILLFPIVQRLLVEGVL